MVSRVARQMFAMLAGIVVLTGIPKAGVPQSPTARLRADVDGKRITDETRAAQATGDRRSPALIDVLTEVASLFPAQGEDALEIAALEEARHVVLAKYGAHTLEQVALIKEALENQRALGDFAMVQALEEQLLDLAERHPDVAQTAGIHRDIGARRMDLVRRFRAYEYPAELYPESELWSVSPHGVVMDLVLEAQTHYADAIAVLLRNGLYSSDELRDLELDIVPAADLARERNQSDWRSAQLGARRMDHMGLGGGLYLPSGGYVRTRHELRERTNTLWDLAASESPDEAKQRRYRVDRLANQYELARESYRRLIDYAETGFENAPADRLTWRRRVEPYVQLADWDLVHSVNGIALDEYAQVYEMLAAGSAAPLIAEIFAPPIPIVLPTFRPNPFKTQTSVRFIDVAFEVTKYGKSRHIQIVNAVANVSDAEKDELVSSLKSSRFRPRVADGQLAASPMRLRYYLPE